MLMRFWLVVAERVVAIRSVIMAQEEAVAVALKH
jgi:hypothetical protein